MDDTTPLNYWLNWRFLLCTIWVFLAMIFSTLLIWKYEGHNQSRNGSNGDDQHEAVVGFLYGDETWRTCFTSVHPIWLLGYRIIAFRTLLGLLIADVATKSGRVFYFYTQWTFTLVTIYFGLGSLLSVHGCLNYCNIVKPEKGRSATSDAEHGSYIPPTLKRIQPLVPNLTRISNHHDGSDSRNVASVWNHSLQIIFQMCSGAVALTDSVYWLVIYPFLTSKYYRLSYLVVCMHSVNAIFLLGDAILNRLQFPFFWIAYFVLWTCMFVIFQWIIHIFVSIRWPYPFLGLSSPYAPLWYFEVGLLHLPCFGIFSLIYCIKRRYLSR